MWWLPLLPLTNKTMGNSLSCLIFLDWYVFLFWHSYSSWLFTAVHRWAVGAAYAKCADSWRAKDLDCRRVTAGFQNNWKNDRTLSATVVLRLGVTSLVHQRTPSAGFGFIGTGVSNAFANQLFSFLKRIEVPKRGAVHGFAGSYDQAKRFVDLGYSIGVGGTITYERANKTRQTIAKLPLDALLLETDSPDMPVFGFQGQPNRPERVQQVFKVLCELRRETPEMIAETIWQNSLRKFAWKKHHTFMQALNLKTMNDLICRTAPNQAWVRLFLNKLTINEHINVG